MTTNELACILTFEHLHNIGVSGGGIVPPQSSWILFRNIYADISYEQANERATERRKLFGRGSHLLEGLPQAVQL